MFQILGSESQEFNQWEQGKMVTNPCMKAGDEVVFRNSSGATAVMIAREESGQVVCDVPNKLLQMCCNILVDLEQGSDQHSDCQTTFTVNPAQKPDGYKCVDNSVPDTRISFNDLKDKPFYESTEVLFDQRVEIDAENGNMIEYELPLSVGDSVKVTWNGAEYECTVELDENSDGAIFFGNTAFIGGTSNDIPFLFAIGTLDGNAMLVIIAPDYAGQSVSIKIEGNVVHTIDPKYLPDKIGGGGTKFVEITLQITGAATVSVANSSMTFSEIVNLAKEKTSQIVAECVYEGITGAIYLPLYTFTDTYVNFSRFVLSAGDLSHYQITANSDGTWIYEHNAFVLTKK